jgi:glycosyltransferase involved in cell wall biosynthesis
MQSGAPPTVSVCVPTYNGAAFLADTLASIAAQTFDDYEVLIVDDGSTDDTLRIAEAHASAHDRVRVIRNPQRRGSSARNANECLTHARGQWIKFLFQDDLMAPTCLERMLDAGHRGPLVITRHDYVFEPDVDDMTRSQYESLPTLEATLPPEYADADDFCDAVLTHWCINFIGPTSSSLIHRRCIDRYGAFDPNIVTFPDLEYWIRVGSNEGLAIVPERLVSFRVHNRSISVGMRSATDARRYAFLLEPLAVRCKLARDADYAHLRARAHSHHPQSNPERTAHDLVFEERWHVVEARFKTRDGGKLAQWNAFVRAHPAVRAVVRDLDTEMSAWRRVKQFVKARI